MATQPKHKLYSVAESLFVEQGLTCSAISMQLGITEASLSKWRKQMDWDAKRDRVISTPAKIRELLLEEMKSVSEGLPFSCHLRVHGVRQLDGGSGPKESGGIYRVS